MYLQSIKSLVSCLFFTDRSRKDEIKSLTANDFAEFYGRVKGIKDFHRKHPNEVLQVLTLQYIEQFACL